MSGLLAISTWVTDVGIPLVAAALTAAGIVVPLLYQRRRERREAEGLFEKALLSLHRDATFLVERAGLLVAKMGNEPITDEDIAGISSARERLFRRLFDDPRVFDAYFSSESWMTRRAEEKLLLLLGEIDVRLRQLRTTRAIDLFTLFGLYLLQYAGEQDPKARASLEAAMASVREADAEVDAVSSAIFPEWS
jgi:hypothetical protein